MFFFFFMFPIFYNNYFFIFFSFFTTLFFSLNAFNFFDIKRIIASSTGSQLGYIYFFLSFNLVFCGLVLFTFHAVFKCLLFFVAGFIVSVFFNYQDLRLFENNFFILLITLFCFFSLIGLFFFWCGIIKEVFLSYCISNFKILFIFVFFFILSFCYFIIFYKKMTYLYNYFPLQYILLFSFYILFSFLIINLIFNIFYFLVLPSFIFIFIFSFLFFFFFINNLVYIVFDFLYFLIIYIFYFIFFIFYYFVFLFYFIFFFFY